MVAQTIAKDQNLAPLATAITRLKDARPDSNLTAIVMELEKADFKKDSKLPQTFLFDDVSKYVETQKRLQSGAANDNIWAAIRALQEIYRKYGGDDYQVLALYQHDTLRHIYS